ncbi:MAG TPA: class I SAM-dependent methyltransferase [Mucilaginibacter sp.]|jgi:2-polyprenyl-3-methyl-5-hydroxy-6-metoxy-1,4-benzoquinol methylase|nr:class I SAM-dependent methyltransferase [Mucilaginibacter sp.]
MAEYKDYGFTTDEASHTFYYLQQPILSLLDIGKNKCILDLGCGNGSIVHFLNEKGFNAYGTDASEGGIAIASQKQPGRFFVQDLTTGELPAELQSLPFDTIISTEVIEHLYDPIGFIDFCKKCLPKGGELIISTPYHGYLKNLMLGIFNKWDSHLSPTWQGGHIKFWSKNTLSQLLADKGFTIIAFKGCGRVPYFWKSMIIKAKLP